MNNLKKLLVMAVLGGSFVSSCQGMNPRNVLQTMRIAGERIVELERLLDDAVQEGNNLRGQIQDQTNRGNDLHQVNLRFRDAMQQEVNQIQNNLGIQGELEADENEDELVLLVRRIGANALELLEKSNASNTGLQLLERLLNPEEEEEGEEEEIDFDQRIEQLSDKIKALQEENANLKNIVTQIELGAGRLRENAKIVLTDNND